MKVKIVNKADPAVTFGSVSAGELFSFGSDVFICTDSRHGVNLTTGQTCPMHPADRVLTFDHDPLVCRFR